MKKQEEKQFYPITSPQVLIRLGDLISLDYHFKNIACLLTEYMLFDENEDTLNIEKAFNNVLKNTDCLRLCMKMRGFRIMQYVEPYKYTPLETVRINGGYEALMEAFKDLSDYKITWGSKPLYIAKLFVYDGGKALLIRAHHAIVDGYSLALILKRIESSYLAFAEGKEPADEKTGSVTEYFKEQQEYLRSKEHKEDKKYWTKLFLSQKHYKYPAGRPSLKMSSAVKHVTVEREKFDKLLSLCDKNGYSLTTAGMSIVSLAFYLYTGVKTFSFYTLTHGRDNYKMKKIAGCMMRIVPMFFSLSEDATANEYLTDTYYNYLECLKHSKSPMGDYLVASYPDAVKNGFNFNHGWMLYSKIDLPNVANSLKHKCGVLDMEQIAQQFYFSITETPEHEIQISFYYQTHRFTAEQVDAIFDCYFKALDFCINTPDNKIGELYKER
ncbi:MAG: condensation domain-containing protein [Clostridia bacterium]|nr:condensation domain-containing protein [Clostridia bacterium]